MIGQIKGTPTIKIFLPITEEQEDLEQEEDHH